MKDQVRKSETQIVSREGGREGLAVNIEVTSKYCTMKGLIL